MEKISNYEKLCQEWAEKFTQMDHLRLQRLLPELRREGNVLVLRHFGRGLAIDRRTGQIAARDGGPLSWNERLNVYTLFAYCREGAALTGKWVPFRSIPGAGAFAPAFDRGVLRPLAATFSGKTEALRRAAAALGGTPLTRCDAGFLLPAFACIPMQLLFWDGDDEFPAQANLLYDAGVTDFIHVESTVTLAGVALTRLAEAAGLPLARGAF